MNRFAAISCLIGSLCPFATPARTAQAQDAVEFKHARKAGDVWRQRIVGTSVGAMQLAPSLPSMNFSQTFTQDFTSTIRRANPDGSGVLDVTIDRIAMKQSTGGMNVEFDSATFDPGNANDVEATIGKIFNALLHSKLTVTVNANGQPERVEGLAEMMDRVFNQIGKEVPSMLARQILEPLKKALSDKSLAEQWGQYSRMVPPRGTKRIGETWEASWSMPMPFSPTPLEGKGRYELVGVEELSGRRCAKIRIKEEFRTRPEAPAAANTATQPAEAATASPLKMNLSSAGGEGIAYVDVDAGLLIRLRQTQDITIEMTIGPFPDSSEELLKKGVGPMRHKFKTSVTIDLLDGEAPAAKPAAETSTAP